jgi:deoxyribose-phosphate aldolase
MSIRAAIEHTRLAPDTTEKEVDVLCAEARERGFAGVCVGPLFVPRVSAQLRGSTVRVVTVVGFPLGQGAAASDAFAAARACDDGAQEIDMVIPIGLAIAGQLERVEAHVAAVRRAVSGAVLKVILETGFFAPAAIASLADVCVRAGADYLKTSTGFGPRGASVEDVAILARIAGGAGRSVGVKASGGIRSLGQARALLAAGATRLGTSRGVELAKEEDASGAQVS